MLARVGGADAISRIVESFYVRIEADSHMRPIYPEDLEPGKEKLKLFLLQWLGGPPAYSQRYGHPRLRIRHFPFVIDDLAAGLRPGAYSPDGLIEAAEAPGCFVLGVQWHPEELAGRDARHRRILERFVAEARKSPRST